MLQNILLEKLAQRSDALLILEELNLFFAREKENRQHFHELLDDDLNAEFINGKIVQQPLVTYEHLAVSANLSMSLHGYVKQNRLGKIGIEKVMISLTRNDYQPGICFFTKTQTETFYPAQILFPAPAFIIEIISPATEALSRTIKMQDYAAHGVTEYWIIDPVQQFVEQYILNEGQYELKVKLNEGVIFSRAIEGYSIDLKEIFETLP